LFFFNYLSNAPETKHIPNHVITSTIDEMPQEVQEYKDQLDGRAIWVRRAQVLPVEAIVRGYITGKFSYFYLSLLSSEPKILRGTLVIQVRHGLNIKRVELCTE